VRKFLIFILAMVLVFALLVPVSARAVEFVFWTTESEAEGLLQTIEELCREFEKENPGVRIETLNYDVVCGRIFRWRPLRVVGLICYGQSMIMPVPLPPWE